MFHVKPTGVSVLYAAVPDDVLFPQLARGGPISLDAGRDLESRVGRGAPISRRGRRIPEPDYGTRSIPGVKAPRIALDSRFGATVAAQCSDAQFTCSRGMRKSPATALPRARAPGEKGVRYRGPGSVGERGASPTRHLLGGATNASCVLSRS